MSRIIEIKEFKGLWTFGDQDDIPNEFLSVIKNGISRVGKIIKTYGLADFDSTGQEAVSITSGYVVYGLICHFDSNYTTPTGYRYYLVCVDSTTKAIKLYYYNTTSDAWAALTWPSGNTYYQKSEFKAYFQTFSALRILAGNVGNAITTYEAKCIWLGWINRSFFWNSAIKTTNALYDSIAAPNNDDYSAIISVDGESYGADLFPALNTYFYKFTMLFDDNQESLLPVDATEYTVTNIQNATRIQVAITHAAWNLRMTGIKIYRATTIGGTYYNIGTISAKNYNEDSNLIYKTGCITGYGVYVPGASWDTDDHVGFYLTKDFLTFYEILSNTSDCLVTSVATPKVWGTENWYIVGLYQIFDAICGTGFEINDFSDWSIGLATIFRQNTAVYSGSYSGGIANDPGETGGWVMYGITGISGNRNINISAALRVLDDATGITIKLEVKDNVAALWSEIGNSTSETWAVVSDVYLTSVGAQYLYLRITVDDSGYTQGWGLIDSLFVNECQIGVSITKLYSGANTIINSGYNFSRSNDKLNWRVLIGDGTNGNNDASALRRRVTANVTKALKVDSDITAPYLLTDAIVYLCDRYVWQLNAAGVVNLWFYDKYLADGSEHYLSGEVSIKVNGKFARILNERLYLANIVLDPGGANEAHSDWFAYSEAGYYDVVPVSNAGNIPNKEGGEITGMATQFGSLIFFFARSIFRITPTTTGFDYKESRYQDGCIAPQGYCEVGNEVYYCGYEAIYRLDPNIGAETDATPRLRDRISEPIRDIYMALTDAKKALILAAYDQVNDEIVFKFDTSVFYAYNVKEDAWRQIDSAEEIDVLGYDENNNIIVYDNTDKKVYQVTNDLSTNKESVAFNIKTKEFYIADDEKTQCVRYVTVIYKSAVALKLKLYVNNSATVVTFTNTGLDYITIPASTVVTQLKLAIRYYCGRFQVEILEDSASTSSVELNKLKIECD